MMQTRQIFKRVALVLAAAVVLSIGLSASELALSGCACVTTNQAVVMELNWLDKVVQQYAVEHQGLYPTYDEFVNLVGERIESLTPRVDLASRNFTFTLALDDGRKIGYAVSHDRREYVLLGSGLTQKYQTVRLFGVKIWQKFIGYEFPILYPGDTPPGPSPIS